MIHDIYKFNEINTSNWDDDTLLLLDIDDTIVVPKEKVIRNANHDKRVYIQDKIRENVGEHLVDEILAKQGYVFVDDNFKNFYDNLNVPTVCITTRRTGKMYSTSNPSENSIINGLKELGITLNPKKYPNNVRIPLEWRVGSSTYHKELYPFYRPDKPMIKEGIIFCCNIQKHQILENYLNQMLVKPKKIVMVDDKLKHLELVKGFCEKYNLEYELYNFKGADLLDNKISNEAIEKRIEFMVKTKSYAPESDF